MCEAEWHVQKIITSVRYGGGTFSTIFFFTSAVHFISPFSSQIFITVCIFRQFNVFSSSHCACVCARIFIVRQRINDRQQEGDDKQPGVCVCVCLCGHIAHSRGAADAEMERKLSLAVIVTPQMCYFNKYGHGHCRDGPTNYSF